MATEVDWGSMGGKASSSGGKKGSKYLSFQPDQVYTVRLVGQAVEFYKYYLKEFRKSLYFDAEDRDNAAKTIAAVLGLEAELPHRWAVNVIDRSDGKIKILEGGWSIFKFFANWARVHDNAHPGGKAGVDWTISVEGNDFQSRRYTTMPDKSSPFTSDEIKMIKEKGNLFPLKQEFKSTPVDQISQVVEELRNPPAETSDSGPEPAAQTVAATSAAPEPAVVGADLSDNPDDWF